MLCSRCGLIAGRGRWDDCLATFELAQLVEIELVESQQSFPLDLIPYLYDTIGIMKKI